MHFELSSEQQMLVETVRRFVETELYPHEKLVEDTDNVPADLAEEIRREAARAMGYEIEDPEEEEPEDEETPKKKKKKKKKVESYNPIVHVHYSNFIIQ